MAHGISNGGGHYQPTLKITYDYKGSSAEDASALSVPRDDNLVVQKVQFKVDGKKVDARPDYQVTYYSYGKEVPVLLPDGEGSKVSVTAFT